MFQAAMMFLGGVFIGAVIVALVTTSTAEPVKYQFPECKTSVPSESGTCLHPDSYLEIDSGVALCKCKDTNNL